MDLNRVIKSRHSVKKFKEKKPDWRDIVECIDAARFAPMAGSNYSLKFILVSNKNIIEQLADAAQQPFITKAHYVVVACSNPSRTVNAYGKKGEDYVRQQAGAAIQNFLLKLEESGLSTTWVGHFVDEQVKKSMKIPEHIQVEAFFPIGYESGIAKTKQKRKIELDQVLFFEEFGKRRMGT